MNAQKFITEANIHQVCKALGWSDLQYKSYQEQTGLDYLQSVVGADDWGLDHLKKTPIFWSWWINHWNKRDQEFLSFSNPSLSLYHSMNAHEGFEFYPHRIIMEQSYAILQKEILERTEVSV